MAVEVGIETRRGKNPLKRPSQEIVFNKYEELSLLPGQFRSGVAIGNFDGVHLGHQHLLKQLMYQCEQAGLNPAVLTFNPNPAKRFLPKEFVGLLFNPSQKYRALHDFGAQLVLDQSFDSEFAMMDPEHFVTRVLLSAFHAELVVVGTDFRFAKGRSGNVETLKSLFEKSNHKLLAIDLLSRFEHATSSSVIRKFIIEGQVANAKAALGRSFSIEGKVVRGKQLGRTLGFPTANISLADYVHPKRGVYRGSTVIHDSTQDAGLYTKDDRALLSAINIGIKPTFSGVSEALIEIHILDKHFDFDFLYDKTVTVFLDDFIREEKKFQSLEELSNQISSDIGKIKSISE